MIYRLKKIWSALNQKERQYVASLGTVCGIALLVIAWLFVVSITTVIPTAGGTFREGIVGQPSSLNPLLASNQAEEDLTHLLFSPLQDLTESIEPSRDGSFWTIRLKENLLWHDDEPLTSDDLIFTIEQIENPSTHSPLFASWQNTQIERLSEREVKITPPPRSSPLLFEEHLRRLLLIPKHIFASIPPQNWPLSEYNLKPIGNGPYRFQEMLLHNNGFLESYSLQAFSKINQSHPPFIQTILVRLFKDQEEAKTAFRYGTIDGLGGVDPFEAKSIARPNHTVLYPTPSYYAVFLNQSQNDLLKNQVIRQVLDQTTPRQELVENVLNNYGKPILAPSLLGTTGTSTDIAALLSDQGWEIASGKLVKVTGSELTPVPVLELTVPDLPFLEHTAQILKTAWEQAGFTVTIKTLPNDTVVNEVIPHRDYQMLLFGNIPQPASDLYPFWHSSQIFHPGLNLSLYKNNQMDNLLRDVRSTMSSTSLQEINSLLREDLPAIFLYSPSYVYVTTKEIEGLEATSSLLFPYDRFGDVVDWYMRTRRVLK